MHHLSLSRWKFCAAFLAGILAEILRSAENLCAEFCAEFCAGKNRILRGIKSLAMRMQS
jgi:hypothetical protein